jgi:hypothetical protein
MHRAAPGVGIPSMEERVNQVGGTLELDSSDRDIVSQSSHSRVTVISPFGPGEIQQGVRVLARNCAQNRRDPPLPDHAQAWLAFASRVSCLRFEVQLDAVARRNGGSSLGQPAARNSLSQSSTSRLS